MKKLIIGALCLTTAAAAAGNSFEPDTASETRNAGKFTAVHAQGPVNVEVTVGKAPSISVVADRRIIDKLFTRVENGILKIGLEKGSYGTIKNLDVMVTTPSLKSAFLHGSGDLMIDGLKDQDFSLNLSGSGDAMVSGDDLGAVDVTLRGSGDIVVEGECSKITAALQGSGDIEADDLECAQADVSLRGSGDVEIYASQSASVRLNGSGDVEIYGDPEKVSSNVRGSGDVSIN